MILLFVCMFFRFRTPLKLNLIYIYFIKKNFNSIILNIKMTLLSEYILLFLEVQCWLIFKIIFHFLNYEKQCAIFKFFN